MSSDSPLISSAPSRLKVCAVRAVFVILGLVAWHWTQGLLGARAKPAEDDQLVVAGAVLVQGDALLELSRPLNVYLNEHRPSAHALLVISSAMIDVLGVFLLGWSVFGSSMRPFVGLLLLFGLRQITQTLCALPPPPGIIWDYPGFPSLLVTYLVENDFFFSGHTAIAVFGAIELGRFVRGWLPGTAAWVAQWVIGIATVFLMAVVLVLRAHYTMDVFTGFIAAVLAAILAGWIAPRCDDALGRIVGRGSGVPDPS
jgi:membrane-associated phospholipid phosphatase